MKCIQLIIIIFAILLLSSCTSTIQINGKYTNVFAGIAGEEFSFTRDNKFQYFSKTEGRIKEYSSGIWSQKKKEIVLNGYNSENLNTLNIESNITNNHNNDIDKISVEYKHNPLDVFTRVEIEINEDYKIRITGDTTFNFNSKIKTLQVKSYLSHEGILLANPEKIDTIYSHKIDVSNINKEHKLIFLKFGVTANDFYRIKLTDTLTIKNKNTVIWHNREFKRRKE